MIWQSITHYFQRVGFLDFRSLAILRFGCGIIVFSDVINRLFYFTRDYSVDGVVPLSRIGLYPRWTLHTLWPSDEFQLTLMISTALLGLAVAVGFKTRWTTLLCLIFLISLQHRNPALIYGFDRLLRHTLLIGCFLPWGAVWSYDTKGSMQRTQQQSFFGGTFAFQLGCMYLFAFLSKTHPIWLEEHRALEYVFSNYQFVRPFGEMMLQFPGLLQALSLGALALWLSFPFIIFSPIKTEGLRTFAVIAICAAHTFIYFGLRMDFFQQLSIVTVLGLLPAAAWGWTPLRKLQQLLNRFFHTPALPTTTTPGRLYSLTGSFALGAIILLLSLSKLEVIKLPKSVRNIAMATGVYQNYHMFAPSPVLPDGWYIEAGLFQNGETRDFFSDNTPVHFEQPADISSLIANQRTRKLYIKYLRRKDRLRLMVDFRCRQHTKSGNPLVSVSIYHMDMTGGIAPKLAATRRYLGTFSCEDLKEIAEPETFKIRP